MHIVTAAPMLSHGRLVPLRSKMPRQPSAAHMLTGETQPKLYVSRRQRMLLRCLVRLTLHARATGGRSCFGGSRTCRVR